jgi:hypothetical protein
VTPILFPLICLTNYENKRYRYITSNFHEFNLSLTEHTATYPMHRIMKTCYELDTICTKLSIYQHSVTYISANYVLCTYVRKILLKGIAALTLHKYETVAPLSNKITSRIATIYSTLRFTSFVPTIRNIHHTISHTQAHAYHVLRFRRSY